MKCMGYYWPTMVTDSINYARSCHQCQIHGDISHVAARRTQQVFPGLFRGGDSTWQLAVAKPGSQSRKAVNNLPFFMSEDV